MRYKEIALALAEYLLQNNEGLISYTMGITLLQCADCNEYIPKYFTPEFVISALAEGVSKNRMDEFAQLSYRAACIHRNYEGYLNTYLSVKTLHQNYRYYEYHQKTYTSADYPEISAIDISEIQALPVAVGNIESFGYVLVRCSKLFSTQKVAYKDRAIALYHKWFDSLSPSSFVPLLPDDITEENAWEIRTSDIGMFLQNWRTVAAELDIPLHKIDGDKSEINSYAEISFGDPYFACCIEHKKYPLAQDAIIAGYVTQRAFSEKIEDIYYDGASQEFKEVLSRVKPNKEKPSVNLLAQAMIISIDPSYVPKQSILETPPK